MPQRWTSDGAQQAKSTAIAILAATTDCWELPGKITEALHRKSVMTTRTVWLSEWSDGSARREDINSTLKDVAFMFVAIDDRARSESEVFQLTKYALDAAAERNVPLGLLVEEKHLDMAYFDNSRVCENVLLLVTPHKNWCGKTKRFRNLKPEHVLCGVPVDVVASTICSIVSR